MNIERSNLLRWCIWFFLGNILLFWLLGLKYFSTIGYNVNYLTSQGKILLTIFLASGYIGQFALFAIIPFFIILPFIWFRLLRRFVYVLSIFLATFIACLFLADVFVYSLYKFHLTGVILNLAFFGMKQNLFGLSGLEKISAIAIVLSLLLLECLYAKWLWCCCHNRLFLNGWLKWIILFLCFCLYIVYSAVFFITHPVAIRVFLEEARFLPFYVETVGVFLKQKEARLGLIRIGEKIPFQAATSNKPLNYPIQILPSSFPKNPMNLVMMVIDSWRFDMLNKEVTPNIDHFAKKAWVFTQHTSGGNATGPGIFSLFYALPATYWTSMETQHRGPIFLDEMQKYYQIGIFSSANLMHPPLDRTVFQSMPYLQTTPQLGSTPNARDILITEKFKKFIGQASTHNKPFFSFLFYDASHSYCDTDDSGPFLPIINFCNRIMTDKSMLLFNRYKNAVHFVDQQVKQVIDALQSQGLLGNTVVIITGDHGEEFDDNHLGYLGHAGNYTKYQIQVPLVVFWPGEKAQLFEHRTNHFDIVPTLMVRLLNNPLPFSDYSLGMDLLDDKPRMPQLVVSYINFGILESDRIITIFPTGDYNIDKINGESMPNVRLNMGIMQKVFHDMRRFYKA